MNSKIKSVALFLALALGTAAVADVPKFHAAAGPEPVIGRYVVTLDASAVAADDPAAVARALASSFGGRLEPFASGDARQFAISMLPSRAKLLSGDVRVADVTEVRPGDAPAAVVAPAAPSTPPAQTTTPPAAAAPASIHRTLRPLMTSVTYAYDGAGNISAIGGDAFRYDRNGRLKDATVSGRNEIYEYDQYGNMLSATRPSAMDVCVKQCTVPPTPDAPTNHVAGMTYDEAGNVKTSGGTTYAYDGLGMPVEEKHGTDVRQYVYTAGGERIAVRSAATWTWTVRDLGGKPLREFTSMESGGSMSARTWVKDYVWRDGQLLASVAPTTPDSSTFSIFHYHLDHLGTPRLITNDSGVVIGKHTYYPFGPEMKLADAMDEATLTPLKFTGHQRDEWEGESVDYMHARYSAVASARFLSPDPVLGDPEVPQSWNRYVYARNSPLVLRDPTGEIVDLSRLSEDDRTALIDGLNEFTGNTYGVDDDNNLVLLSVGPTSSETATSFVNGLISSDNCFNVVATTTGSNFNDKENRVEINFASFTGANYNGVDRRTFNLGSTAIHEWMHQLTGLKDTLDGKPTSPAPEETGWTGPIVDSVNVMRSERGLPVRESYMALPVRPAGWKGVFSVGQPRQAIRFLDPKTGTVKEVVRDKHGD